MLFREPLESLIMLFRTSLIKILSQRSRMSDSFYHITESSELNKKYGSNSYSFDHVGQSCFGIFAQEYIGTVL